jgi:3-dehydroquinate synthase
MESLIARSIAIKADVVTRDEREGGLRKTLNFGHTLGHAIETLSGYSLLHGEAVAIGMALAFEFSVRQGLCPGQDAARARRHLDAVGLPASPAALGRDFAAGRLVAHMRKDKKVEGGRLTFILARGIGGAFVAKDVPASAVEAFLADILAPRA